MSKLPATDDLRVFTAVARKASFAAAALALDVSPAYVSKRVAALERSLGLRLLHRTTRRVTVTEQGERVFQAAQHILDGVDQLVEVATQTRQQPRGLLRVSSSFGFGRRVVAPALAELTALHPQLQVRLELFDRPVDLAAEGFDLDVCVGDRVAPHLLARPLAANHRVLCASPAYVQRRGLPRTVADLAAHDCLVIRERDHVFGTWRLQGPGGEAVVQVSGPLSANDGEAAVQWALSGRGVVLRSLWDVAPHLASGALLPVLPDWQQSAPVWAVYPSRLETSAKVRVCVQFLQQRLANLLPAPPRSV